MTSHPLQHARPGVYRGQVTGEESGSCSARIELRHAPGGVVVVDYEATSEREGLQHQEHTLVTPDALHVAFSEAPGVTVFAARERGVFAAPPGGPFAMEIHVSAQEDTVVWAWHWAEAGATPREMSRAVVHRTDH